MLLVNADKSVKKIPPAQSHAMILKGTLAIWENAKQEQQAEASRQRSAAEIYQIIGAGQQAAIAAEAAGLPKSVVLARRAAAQKAEQAKFAPAPPAHPAPARRSTAPTLADLGARLTRLNLDLLEN